MDKNTIIGLSLIFLLLVIWQQFNAPSAEDMEVQKRIQDSIVMADNTMDVPVEPEQDEVIPLVDTLTTLPDSVKNSQLGASFGPFATSATGASDLITLENDLMKVIFSTKGGNIREVELKKYYKILEDTKGKEEKTSLKLLEDKKNKFEYFLPVANLPAGGVRTGDLYFQSEKEGENTIVFRAPADNGGFFEQKYTINPGTYKIDYDIRLEGLQQTLANDAQQFTLNWINYLDKIERNTNYERNYSTVYFKPVDDGPDYCSCTSSDVESIPGQRLKWVSNTNQFFNSSLVADSAFAGAVLETVVFEPENEDMKALKSEIYIPYAHSPSETFAMDFYVGPNEFDRLRAIGYDLEDIIPFGWSIFGTINRWIIRPVFNFLSGFIGSAGIVILALTFLVKLVLFPLTYKMLYSQSKMAALKPQMEGVKSKFKDDAQQQQMETMKMYREFGVNPLGGCMPMVLQMPIWFALYRFFPASIEFRQAGFLWATDLSSYDVFVRLPFELPLGFGAHISLFTFLWAITTLIYTYYNTKHMDMSANPAMKYMQYLMPIMFLGFFNSFASGLTCYLLFSNLFNITQTVVTKNFIIDNDKILKELEANKKKPKKKSGFQARLETALKEQQKVQASREQGNKTKDKKKK